MSEDHHQFPTSRLDLQVESVLAVAHGNHVFVALRSHYLCYCAFDHHGISWTVSEANIKWSRYFACWAEFIPVGVNMWHESLCLLSFHTHTSDFTTHSTTLTIFQATCSCPEVCVCSTLGYFSLHGTLPIFNSKKLPLSLHFKVLLNVSYHALQLTLSQCFFLFQMVMMTLHLSIGINSRNNAEVTNMIEMGAWVISLRTLCPLLLWVQFWLPFSDQCWVVHICYYGSNCTLAHNG
jgi:hypothetical protein